MNRTLLHSALVSLLIPYFVHSPALAQLAQPAAAPEKTKVKNECEVKDAKAHELANGLILRMGVTDMLRKIIQKEQANGNDPKVVVIGRAGQDLGGAMVLRDSQNGQDLSLDTIFRSSIVNVGESNITSTGSAIDKDKTVAEIKKNYADPNRKLVYSHVALLFLDHSVKYTARTMSDGEVLHGGDYWAEELLKPCENLTPKAWITGLSQFFQDDPHDYRAIIYVPTQAIQDELYKLVEKDHAQKNFLAKTYNAAGNYNYLKTDSAKDDKYHNEQNSNQYVLELIAAAQLNAHQGATRITHRDQAASLLHQWGYSPTKIIANSFMTSMATSFFAPGSLNVRNELHPYARPYNIVEMVTELSVREYMLKTRAITPTDIYEVVIPKNELVPAETKSAPGTTIRTY